MNGLSWDGLRYFIAAAEEGSLTAAARSLHSNQPTVGRHIDNLESSLGVKLFQRSVKGLTLTEEGVALLEHCRAIRAQIVKIERSLGGEMDSGGTVKVALPEGLSLEVVLPQLERFYRDYPNIRLLLNVSSSTANLSYGEADIAIRLFRPDEANLVVRRLGGMAMGLYAAATYLDRYGTPSTVTELAHHRIIAYGDRLGSLPENRWLLQQAAPVVPILRSDSTSSRLQATRHGIGISIQPQAIVQNDVQLKWLLPEVEVPGHEMWLVYHKDLRQVARMRAVADFLVSAVTQARQ